MQSFSIFLEFEINRITKRTRLTLAIATDWWDLVQVSCHEGNDQVKQVSGAHGHVISTDGLTLAVRRRTRRRYRAPPDFPLVAIEQGEYEEHDGGGGIGYWSPEQCQKTCPVAVLSSEPSIMSYI
jgi:hypothetical protein